jgi:hypothetical protein
LIIWLLCLVHFTPLLFIKFKNALIGSIILQMV